MPGTLPDPRVRRDLRRRLLSWYDAHRRRLPWRERPSLYGTWISEIMLQQTTVAAAAPYWERFVARLPDVRALAAADEGEVLALWAGLGYYRRARDLHAAARRIARAAGGRLPDDFAGWRALPGVGRYTAGAIASIGLGQRVAAVDANARRVLVRWLCATPAAAATLAAAELEHAAAELSDPRRPGDWNQAVMELGALVCRPADPDCARCPVRSRCRAGLAGTTALVPPLARRARPERRRLSLLVLRRRRDGAVLLVPADGLPAARLRGLGATAGRGFDGLCRGLWSLPATAWYPAGRDGRSTPDLERASLAAWRRWLAARRAPAELAAAGTLTHAVTAWRLKVAIVGATGGGAAAAFGSRARWWRPDQEAPPLTGLASKALRRAGALP